MKKDEGSLCRVDSGKNTNIWVIFQVKKWRDLCWRCSAFRISTDEQNKWKCGLSEGICLPPKTEKSLSVKFLTCWECNLGQFRAFFKTILHVPVAAIFVPHICSLCFVCTWVPG